MTTLVAPRIRSSGGLSVAEVWPLAAAVATMACAGALTRVLWRSVEYTPFLFGFAAVISSSRLGGRRAGFLAVAAGVVGYGLFPPPFSQIGFGRLISGFAI